MCSTLGSPAAQLGWNLIGMARTYTIPAEKKQDPVLRWHLPDRVFFACGACHVLAYAFFAHTRAKACRGWPGWSASLVELPIDVLVSESKSKAYDGLWLREPGQFLHNAMPRAEAFLDQFPPPRWPLEELRPRSAAAAERETISGSRIGS
jgi:hypothetical protein